MRHPQVKFPAVIGLIEGAARVGLSELAAQQIRAILRDLPRRKEELFLTYEPQSSNPKKIIEFAKEVTIDCRPFVSAAGAAAANEDARRLELIDASDLLLFLHKSEKTPERADIDAVHYAKSVGRPVLEIDTQTGVRSGEIPSNMNRDAGWLADLFELAGVTSDDDLVMIRRRIADLSAEAKPKTTEWWIRLLLVEGLAASLPLMWLTKRYTGMGWIHALAILLAVIAMIMIAWWLRWRGMQKLWARTRLVAEVGRSILATQRLSIFPAFRLFETVSALRPLRWCGLPAVGPTQDLEGWRKAYVTGRIDEQLEYFSEQQAAFERERAALNRWTTLLLDVSLAFAAAGLAAALFQRFAFSFGGAALEVVFAAAGVSSVLALILIQTFASIENLNPRIAIYARQKDFLLRAKRELESTHSRDAATEIVNDVEQQLLQEVIDWYFTTDYGQHFCSIKPTQQKAEGLEPAVPRLFRSYKLQWANRAFAHAGGLVVFVLRVLLGRVAWAVGAAALVALWLGFNLSGSRLENFGQFVDRSGQDWVLSYDTARAKNGCVIIVHGLWGEPSEAQHWTRAMAEAIEKQTAPNSPNILILDWSLAAKPSKAEGANIQGDPIARLYDIGAIRSQAYRLGDLAAVKLKDWIIEDKIDKNAPLYLIGHSAGGFAVARCALTLKKYGTTPRQIHITILDTPVELPLPLIGDITDRELLKELPAQFPGAVDFYASSSAVRLPKDFNVPGLHFEWLDHNSEGLVKDHSYAYQWYIDTIGKPEKSEGFWISRLFKRK